MRSHVPTDSLRDFRYLLGRLFGRLFLLAFLASEAQKRTFECFGDEVSSDAILADRSSRKGLFKVVAVSSRLNEGSFALVLRIVLLEGRRLGLDER